MMKPLSSGIRSSNLIFATFTNDLLIISDRLCLSVQKFCTVSVIGISVKSHIGTSLIKSSQFTHIIHTLRLTVSLGLADL